MSGAAKKSEPRLDLDRTREKLARLGLEHVAERLEDKLTAAARDEIPAYRFLDEILDEVMKLLHQIRGAWAAIPNEARGR